MAEAPVAPWPASPTAKLMLVALAIFAAIDLPASTALEGFRVDLTHVDSGRNFTKLELLQRALKRSKHRVNTLAAKVAAGLGRELEAPVHAGSGDFIVDLGIGTPSVPFPAILDTGSDLVWTQCKPCCRCYKQATPIFDPSASKTFAKLGCNSKLCQALPTSTCFTADCEYLYIYGDNSLTLGVLATETITFGSPNGVSVPDVGFGCSGYSLGDFEPAAGLVGLGRGPLSLTSQLGVGKFSYCLTKPGESKKSPLLFGSLANLSGTHAQSTPFLHNPTQATFYYLSLKGITVGPTSLRFPPTTFAINDDGTGGVIIDSGTTITYLETEGYRALRKAFVSQVKLPVGNGSEAGLDLCFQLPEGVSAERVKVPKLVFHFEGADLDLPPENYMVPDEGSGQLCLWVMGTSGTSILGNFQQQNFHMLYDLAGNKLAFTPAHCDQL
uniref:Aspartic proteinase nepenthesin-1 n=1 Tax=Anthurium amnicola TaxID=1678845 RepID=A0A1D1Z2C9_9ARAE